MKITVTINIPIISFLEKNGWKFTLSLSIWTLIGLDDPDEWSDKIWIILRNEIKNGKIKCSEKNRVKVGTFTENPPQIHSTMVFPQNGIADIKFVITVAAQNDICPHGRTYPINAVAIKINKIIIPTFHVVFILKDFIRRFFEIWK